DFVLRVEKRAANAGANSPRQCGRRDVRNTYREVARTIPFSRLFLETKVAKANDADDQPVDCQAAAPAQSAQQGAGLAGFSAEAGRLHARLYHHAEEAEFGAAQGGQSSSDQWFRSHRIHSRRGP